MKRVCVNRRKKTLHLRWIKAGAVRFVEINDVGRKGVKVQVQVVASQVVIRYMGRRKTSTSDLNQPFRSNRAAQLWANTEAKRLLGLSR